MGARQNRAVFDEVARETFERDGLVKLEAAFSAEQAAAMRRVLWNELERRHGIVEHDSATWNNHEPTGLKTTKRSRVFEPILDPSVRDALDALLGPGRWDPPKTFGNVLVTMPNAHEWRVPHRVWHPDFETTLPTDRLVALKVWALFGDVAPGGGGTPQLLGSHRLFARFVEGRDDLRYRETKLAFLRSHPWLRALTVDDGSRDRNDCFGMGTEIDGVRVRVVEMTGKAGDVFITHPWTFHSIAVNATDRPRFMRSVAIRRRHTAAAGAA